MNSILHNSLSKQLRIERPPLRVGLLLLLVAMSGCEKKASAIHGPPGATCSWLKHEAEDGSTNGAVSEASHQFLTPESEASGRRFVTLKSDGQYVDFKAGQAANSIVVRYSIPDAAGGGGADATLGLYLNGKFERKIKLSSRFSWIYGDFPWSNDPKRGKAHHFFDESHIMIGNIAPGDVVRLQRDASDTAGSYLIDFIELEKIPPPLSQPSGSLSLADFGAVPNDGSDASTALTRCMATATAQKKSVWIPVGEFRLDGGRIKAGNVRVQGAGMWYSKFAGKTAMFEGSGGPVEFSDLGIFGEIDRRVDEAPDNAFDGNFGSGSVFRNLWIEHLKCGFWTRHGTSHMRVEGCRIRNVMADGLNFCDGTSDSVVEQCHLRNTGDDALATWSPSGSWSSKTLCERNRFVQNTIELPWLANCIAIYGGADHQVLGNLMLGTVSSGGGVLISSRFDALPFSGTIQVDDNTIRDAGGDCYIGESVGAVWIHAKQSDIDATVSISRLHIEGGPKSGITIHGPKEVSRLELHDVVIDNVAEHGIEVKPNVGGSLHASGLHVNGSGLAAVNNETSGRFSIRLDDAN